MPTKPTDPYTWDSNQTNYLVTTASQRTDGWVGSTQVPSTYFNGWMNIVYRWLVYFEAVTDALDSLMGSGDITATFDSDGTSSTNAFIFKHDSPAVEVARINESANFLLNQATAGTSGTAVIGIKTGTEPSTQVTDVIQLYSKDFAAGDARFNFKSETGNNVTIGNGTVISDNVLSTNLTDITNTRIQGILSSLVWTTCTDADVIDLVTTSGARVIGINGTTVGSSYYVYIDGTAGASGNSGRLPTDGSFSLSAASPFATIDNNAFYSNVYDGTTYLVNVGDAGIIYTSVDPFNVWTSRTSGTANNLGFVAFGNSFFVAAGRGANNTLRYNDSNPTDAWSGSTSGLDGTTTFTGLDFGVGLFVAATSDNEIITTADPSGAWTLRTNPITGGTGGLRFCGDRFFMWGASGKLATSTNGTTWSDVSINAAYTIKGAAGIFLGTGLGYLYVIATSTAAGPVFFYSTNGSSWSAASITVSAVIGVPSDSFYYDATSGRFFLVDSNKDLVFTRQVPKFS